MSHDSVEGTILEYVRKVVHPGVQADTRLVEEGLLDSFDAVEVIDFIEERFEIRIAPADMAQEDFGSVAAMARFVERKRGWASDPA